MSKFALKSCPIQDKEYKVAEFDQHFSPDKIPEPAFLYQKGIASVSMGSTADTFKPMLGRYSSCLPTRKKEQEILQKKKLKLPYVIEDGGGKQAYTGIRHGDDQGSYVMLLLNGKDALSVIPIKDWYSFTPKIHCKKLSLEEAEAEQSKREEKFVKNSKKLRGDAGGEEEESESISSSYQDKEDGVFSGGGGGRTAIDDEGDAEAVDESENVAIEEFQEMSDDEDVMGMGHLVDLEDVDEIIEGMQEDSDSDDSPEGEAAPNPNEEGDPNKPEVAPGAEGAENQTELEGEESRKRALDAPAEEPARKRLRTDITPMQEGEDQDGRVWERKAEEHVKRVLSKRGDMSSAKLLKYARKHLLGLSDKKKKGKFFKIVKKLAVVKEAQGGEKVLSLKPQYMPTV